MAPPKTFLSRKARVRFCGLMDSDRSSYGLSLKKGQLYWTGVPGHLPFIEGDTLVSAGLYRSWVLKSAYIPPPLPLKSKRIIELLEKMKAVKSELTVAMQEEHHKKIAASCPGYDIIDP